MRTIIVNILCRLEKNIVCALYVFSFDKLKRLPMLILNKSHIVIIIIIIKEANFKREILLIFPFK